MTTRGGPKHWSVIAHQLLTNLRPDREQPMTTDPTRPAWQNLHDERPTADRLRAEAAAAVFHVGRSWNGPGPLEAECPCPKAPCGLVATDTASPDCDQHGPPPHPPRSMRSGHAADRCPGSPE